MLNTFRRIASLIVIAFSIGALSSCTSSSVDMKSVSAVIDVRTQEEWATGHLDGAINIDIESADFPDKIGSLDHFANYVIYCRSGNRAGKAIDYMKANGFTGALTNAGSVADASSITGMKVIQ